MESDRAGLAQPSVRRALIEISTFSAGEIAHIHYPLDKSLSTG